MASKRSSPWPIVTLLVGIVCFIIALPDGQKSWAPTFLKPELRLGLDLAGGTQLDFRISEDELNEREDRLREEIKQLERDGSTIKLVEKQNELTSLRQQQKNVVEAIRTVLERRINALGVSEATITPSYFGSEKHLLVDCPGVINAQECIDTVGKTIQLEFKEQFTEATEEYTQEIREKADENFAIIKRGSGTLTTVGEDLSNELGIGYEAARPYFRSELSDGLETLWNRNAGDSAILTEGFINVPRQNEEGTFELVAIGGIYISEVIEDPKPIDRSLTNPPEALKELKVQNPGSTLASFAQIDITSASQNIRDQISLQTIGSTAVVSGENSASIIYVSGRTDGTQEMAASHILTAYQGASRAEEDITRTKEEALTKTQELLKQIETGTAFEKLALQESDGPSGEKGGSLGTVTIGAWAPSFEKAAFALKEGEISDIVETPFGFHIIRADSTPEGIGATVSYDMLTLYGTDARSLATTLKGQIDGGNVVRTEDQIVLRSIFFSLQPTGWKDTELNGEYFRFASVTTDNFSGIPVVQIQFDEEGARLFQELTKRNIDKPLAIFVGGDLVSAPTVQQEIVGGTAIITGIGNFEEARLLALDLNTGAIPAPIHLSGQSTIEATLGADALNRSVKAGIIGLIALAAFMIFVYRLLGVIADIALLFYLAVFIALMKLPLFLFTDNHIVLTLAGMAGIILSLGMAVDANVLIFERIKEELRKGKSLKIAADTGFKRAWPSIRDGNVSTLITCAILFLIGTSIVRGFAITLSMGILLSLFTAIVVTRWMIGKIAESPLGERMDLFGIKEADSE